MRGRLITGELKILKLISVNSIRLSEDLQRGQRRGRSLELGRHLLTMITVQVSIAQCDHDLSGVQVALLRQHVHEQRHGSDVEGQSQKRHH